MSLRDDLIRDEGDVPYAYLDSRGYWTIGVGFLVDKDKGGRMPPEVRDFWLNLLIDKNRAALVKEFPWVVTRPEPAQRALENMSYQMGVHGVAGFKNMLACLQAGDYLGAATHALDSDYARNDSPVRAQRVADLYRSAANGAG